MDKYMCKRICRIKLSDKNNARSSTYNNKSLEKRYDGYKYGPIHIKWRHTEHEHFGRFQNFIKTLNSSSDTAPLQQSGSTFQILALYSLNDFKP